VAKVTHPLSRTDKQLHGLEGKCFFCGDGQSSAYWRQGGTFEVCSECAISILPALIVDACFFGQNVDRAKALMLKIEGRFWRAVACAVELSAKLDRQQFEKSEKRGSP
jgi:hypothetical protein